jgi:hypothetical protein
LAYPAGEGVKWKGARRSGAIFFVVLVILDVVGIIFYFLQPTSIARSSADC